jgi:hypothetical protein
MLRRAATRLGHESPRDAVTWLQRQPVVASAAIGRDGQTVDLTFRDGQRSEILSNQIDGIGVSASESSSTGRHPEDGVRPGEGSRGRTQNRPDGVRMGRRSPAQGSIGEDDVVRSPADSSVSRALVAEPFATELNLGPHAGDVEAEDLKYVGYSVDQVNDAAVTVDFMKQLPQYSFVYMLTHSGVNQYGEGVIATGQLATAADDAALKPLMDSYAVLKVGVDGTDNIYYGIVSNYIKWYMGQFPPHAVLFLNGCTLLKASLDWQAFQSKGVGALMSWDEKGATQDDVTVGGYAMGELIQGKSVAAAVNATFQAGYGVSNANGIVAKFGYLGDGSLTLRNLLPSPTATPTPTATATATPAPSPTSTMPAPSIAVTSAVRPGARQTLHFQGAPGARIRFQIQYPNGDRQTAERVTDGNGAATYSYVQPPGKLVHSGYSARVVVTDARSNRMLASGVYRILFGTVDISVIPRLTTVHGTIAVWVHTAASTRVRIVLRLPSGRSVALGGHTGPHGWTHPHWQVTGSAGHGRATVTGRSSIGAHTYTARTTFTIR